jgi:hypothetical protein
MATAQSVIDSARYDLLDFVDGAGVGIQFDDEELLNYLNRNIGLMDTELSALNSDLLEAVESDIDCVSGQDYVDISGLNSGLWHNVRRVWLDDRMLERVRLNYMRYTRHYRQGSARPTIWALSGDKILFPQNCGASYTGLEIEYTKKSAALAIDDSMPYRDRFNEFLREMVVVNAKTKKQGVAPQNDMIYQAMFKQRAMSEQISRGHVPKPYVYWGF